MAVIDRITGLSIFILQDIATVRILLLVALSLIVSCGTTVGGGYNPTVHPFEFNEESVAANPIKKVILVPFSIGAPPPSHLRKVERRVKARVKDYLESNGFEIMPSYHFENAWKQAARTYGNVYDPSTGKVDVEAWKGAMITTGEVLRKQTDADAIIFADLFEHNIQHSNSMQHYARWYGVTRKPAYQGAGDGVPVGFDWTQEIKAASLMITIYDTNLSRIFSSRGGIDTLYAVDLKHATPSFVRRRKLLSNTDHVEEGIQLAFHPFITMERYPGTPDQ